MDNFSFGNTLLTMQSYGKALSEINVTLNGGYSRTYNTTFIMYSLLNFFAPVVIFLYKAYRW